ncbi:MAG: hypothetical protein NWF13_08815 [Candidatus Bathyarchaeota archaeon]|nr:hypothetical protein [Candidatus Bathyarchaeota archaeon]
MVDKKTKMLALLSGGLDSTLAVKIMLDQGIDVEAVNFTTPFCLCDKCAVESVGEKFGIKVHRIFLGQEFLDLLVDPPHGYGSQMNPCIDCRIFMFKKAKEIAKRIGAEGIITGEVLNERPFSQRKEAMFVIEKESGVKNKVLRPLSAQLMPETDFEKKGSVDRKSLFSIQGRRRLPQMRLAEEMGINDYPCPSGGCLLTDPQFARRLKEHLRYSYGLNLVDTALLKIGRHFRVDECKIIVGRNEEENKSLLSIAHREKKPYIDVVEYMSPITLMDGKNIDNIIQKAAEITIRYSDAPKDFAVKVKVVHRGQYIIEARSIEDEAVEPFRI